MLDVFGHHPRPGAEAPDRGERFAEGADHQVLARLQAEVAVRPASGRADGADGVRVVDQQTGVALIADGAQLSQRRKIAAH